MPSPDATPPAHLSIYDHPSSPVVLVPLPPSALQHQVSSARKTSEALAAQLRTHFRIASSDLIGAERGFERHLRSLHAPGEDLNPGLLYVGIATLLGSIISRHRILPVRLLTPLAAGGAASFYFIPKTSRNTVSYLEDIERRRLPNWHAYRKKLSASQP